MKRMMLAGAAAALALNGAVATAGEVKVGSAAAVTGPIAELVVAIVNARNLAASHVNEQGGLLGGDTYTARAGRLAMRPEGRGRRGREARQRRAGGGGHRRQLLGRHQRHGPVRHHPGRRGDDLRHRDRALDLRPRRQRPRVPGRHRRTTYTGTLARRARLGARLPQARGHLRQRRLQLGPRRGLRRPPSPSSAAPSPATRRTSRTRHPTAPSSPPSRAGEPEGLALFAYFGSSGITILRNSLENALFGKFLGADGMMDNSVIEQIGADNLRGNIMLSQPASDTEERVLPGIRRRLRGRRQRPGRPLRRPQLRHLLPRRARHREGGRRRPRA